MKKLLLFYIVAAAALAGCNTGNELVRVTTDYKIINQIESDIVVELHSGKIMTINPGDTKVIYNEIYSYNPKTSGPIKALEVVQELLQAEMRIGGEAVPAPIWWSRYWIGEAHQDHFYTYTLTVTNELIETLLSQQNN